MSVKQNILQAGMALLKQQGFAALTQPQVAKAAGCKQSHLTYYFPTRNDLLLAIAEYSVDTMLAELTGRLAEKPQRQTLSDAIVHNVVEGLPPRVLLGLAVAADNDPAIRQQLSRLIDHVRATIKMVLKKSGLASDDDAALLFHAVVVGLAVMHQARQTGESAREIQSGVDVIINKLTPCSINSAGDRR